MKRSSTKGEKQPNRFKKESVIKNIKRASMKFVNEIKKQSDLTRFKRPATPSDAFLTRFKVIINEYNQEKRVKAYFPVIELFRYLLISKLIEN